MIFLSDSSFFLLLVRVECVEGGEEGRVGEQGIVMVMMVVVLE